MLNFFGSFGKIGRWFTGAILATLLFLGLRWLWLRPELINPTARGYRSHVNALQTDSINRHGEITRLDALLSVKDSIITTMGREISTALAYGTQWKDRYTQQVAVSDHATDQLTDKQRELSYYQALLANGTLAPTSTPLSLSSAEVVSAGLKTANREVIARSVNDSLSKTVSYYQSANERLGKGLSSASTGLAQLSQQAYQNQKGGIPLLRRRRVKQAKAMQRKADSLKHVVDEVSGLENYLNKL